MKTLVITINTNNLTENQNIYLGIHNHYTGQPNANLMVEAENNSCHAKIYADEQTIFGSSFKDEFMYHVAISG